MMWIEWAEGASLTNDDKRDETGLTQNVFRLLSLLSDEYWK